MVEMSVRGVHHITAIGSDPVEVDRFYGNVLGLRLVKKSVNQDDVGTYHLFYGDKTGEPGMDLTFFTFQPAVQGVQGAGMVTTIMLAVPKEALDFWEERLDKYTVKRRQRAERFLQERVVFYDKDRQRLELVGVAEDELGGAQVWTTEEIGEAVAIRHFEAARMSVIDEFEVQPVLQLMGYEKVGRIGNISRYRVRGNERAVYLEVEESPLMEAGVNAAGTVHHIAFEVKDEKEQLNMREKVLELGLYPTEVIDRFYFKSVYFRTESGILFELATSGPGFMVDEGEAELGKRLALPPFLEERREEIEEGLEPFEVDEE
jgi:glyoxalase family protein